MKIAVIGVKGLPANQGGIEHYAQELYPKILAQGHSVDLFARASYLKVPWFHCYQVQGLRVICLPSIPIRGLDALINALVSAIASLLFNYDVVHFHALGPSIFTWIPRWFSNAKVVVTCHGLDWQRAKWGKLPRLLIRLGEKMAVQYAHQIIVVSEYLQHYFQETYSFSTLYVPTAPASYLDSDQDFSYVKSLALYPKGYFLFLGRIVPEKRADLLLEAFLQLKLKGWKLVIAGGNGDVPDFISHLLDVSQNNENVVFTGEIKGEKLSEVVRGAGLFVLPSDLEGLPLVILEAMREGIPVLASDIPPHRQLIGQDRGLLFNTGDLDSLVSMLRKVVTQPQQLATMADTAQEYVKNNYIWETIINHHLSVYSELTKTFIKLDKSHQKLKVQKSVKVYKN